MSIQSVARILRDFRSAYNHPWTLLGVIAAYLRDDDMTDKFQRLWTTRPVVRVISGENVLDPSLLVLSFADSVAVFIAGTENSRLMAEQHAADQRVEIPGFPGTIGSFYASRLPALRERLRDVCEGARSGVPVLLAGHSYGAAMALLLGHFYKRQTPSRQLCVFSYAMPRVGDPQFNREALVQHVRTKNVGDAICEWPGSGWIRPSPLIPGANDVSETSNHGLRYVLDWYGYMLEDQGIRTNEQWSAWDYYGGMSEGSACNLATWWYTRQAHSSREYLARWLWRCNAVWCREGLRRENDLRPQTSIAHVPEACWNSRRAAAPWPLHVGDLKEVVYRMREIDRERMSNPFSGFGWFRETPRYRVDR